MCPYLKKLSYHNGQTLRALIYSLESHSLSHKLSWLLSDKEHLLSCLEPWAFLCQENLAEATLLYLRAVERNQPGLLAEIDPCLVSSLMLLFHFVQYKCINVYSHTFYINFFALEQKNFRIWNSRVKNLRFLEFRHLFKYMTNFSELNQYFFHFLILICSFCRRGYPLKRVPDDIVARPRIR